MKRLRSFPLAIVKRTSSQYNKSFHAKFFTLFASSESEVYTFGREHTPHYRYCFAFIENDEGQWFLDIAGIRSIRNWILRNARRGTSHVVRLYRTWQKRFEAYRELSHQLLSQDLATLSDQDLVIAFQRFYHQYLGVGSIAYISDSFMSTGEEDWLETLLRKELQRIGKKNGAADAVRILTSPVHLSFVLEEEHEAMRLAAVLDAKFPRSLPTYAAMRTHSLKIFRMLKTHEERFYWIRNNYFNVEYIRASGFYQRARAIVLTARRKGYAVPKLLREKSRELSDFRRKRQRLLDGLPLSHYHRNVLEIARLFAKWKDVRKSGVYIGMHHFDRFLREIAARRSTTVRDLSFLSFDEILQFFSKRQSFPRTIRERKNKSFFAVTPRGYFIANGRQAEPYFRYFARGLPTEVGPLRGVSASPGCVRGRVRIIRKTEEMRLLKVGEVLVANQTTPEFVPVMKKACAIVTEQGGITSHAAVVSRELHKPCVIGTKIATKVFKDGDMVEVDATRGTVVVVKK